jgi:hypothetical protein
MADGDGDGGGRWWKEVKWSEWKWMNCYLFENSTIEWKVNLKIDEKKKIVSVKWSCSSETVSPPSTAKILENGQRAYMRRFIHNFHFTTQAQDIWNI